jgi:hypothetical protein
MIITQFCEIKMVTFEVKSIFIFNAAPGDLVQIGSENSFRNPGFGATTNKKIVEKSPPAKKQMRFE